MINYFIIYFNVCILTSFILLIIETDLEGPADAAEHQSSVCDYLEVVHVTQGQQVGDAVAAARPALRVTVGVRC